MRLIIITAGLLCLIASPIWATVSTDITLDVTPGELAGSLLLPENDGPWPVVLILAGSGQVDRDGNMVSVPGKNNSLLQLAEGLAEQGIASLRVDKRGVAGSISAGLSERELRFTHLIDDAVQWTHWLQDDDRFSSVSIAGHGQGAEVGMSAAWLAGTDGFVSLAGSGRPILEVLREQLHNSLNIRSRVNANAILDELAVGHLVSEPTTDMTIIFRPSVQKFLISWQRQNPQQMIGRLSCPVTIIQGLNDLQVKEDDARLLHQAKPTATLLLLPGINHLFKMIDGDNPVVHQMALANPELPFSRDAVNAVVALAAEGEIFHKSWAAAIQRTAEFNAQAMENFPAGLYGGADHYSTQPMGQKLSHWISNRTKESHGYRFGLAKDGYATKGQLLMGGYYDCVSFMYRCTELARAENEHDSLAWALRTRFAGAHPDSVVGPDGRVNYDRPEHLDYSLDMIRSGIWGRDISADVGTLLVDDIGTKRYPAGSFSWLPASDLDHSKLQEGDILWFVLNSENAKARKLRDEYGLVVGHLGLMLEFEGRLVLAHAASSDLTGEYKGGQVVFVDLATYLERVDRYSGVFVTRLENR